MPNAWFAAKEWWGSKHGEEDGYQSYFEIYLIFEQNVPILNKNIAWDFDVRYDSKTPRWVFLYPIFSISVECLAGCYRCRKEGEQTYICFRTDTSTKLRFGPSFTFRTSPWIRTDSNFMTSSKAKSSWNPPCGILHHVFNLTLGAKLEIEGSNFSPHTSRAEVKECLKEYRNKERGCSPS